MPALTSNMVNRLYEVAEIFKNFSGPCMKDGAGDVYKFVQLPLQNLQNNPDVYKADKNADNSPLNEEGDARAKQIAGELLGLINQRREEINDGHAHTYENTVLDYLAFYCENAQRGINVCEGSEYDNPIAKEALGQLKQVAKPTNKDAMGTLEEYSSEAFLSDFFSKALDVQKKYVDYRKNRGSDRIKADLTSNYTQMLGILDDMKDSLPQSDSAQQMLGKAQRDLQNKGGIYGAMSAIREECLAQRFDVALERLQTRRSSLLTIFSGQSTDEHRKVVEPALKLQQVLKQLRSGKELDAETKMKLAQDAVRLYEDVEKYAEEYRVAKTKDGRTAPNTPAGQARLGGALELKEMAFDIGELCCRLAGTTVRKVNKARKNAQSLEDNKITDVNKLSEKLHMTEEKTEKAVNQNLRKTSTIVVKPENNNEEIDPDVLGGNGFSLSN